MDGPKIKIFVPNYLKNVSKNFQQIRTSKYRDNLWITPLSIFLHKIMIYMSKKLTIRQLFIMPIFQHIVIAIIFTFNYFCSTKRNYSNNSKTFSIHFSDWTTKTNNSCVGNNWSNNNNNRISSRYLKVIFNLDYFFSWNWYWFIFQQKHLQQKLCQQQPHLPQWQRNKS